MTLPSVALKSQEDGAPAVRLGRSTEAWVRAIAADTLPLAEAHVAGDAAAFAGCGYVACVPARDEAGWIANCLAALDAELAAGDGVVLVANDCTDDTVALAMATFAGWSRPWLLVECGWIEGGGTAPFARRLVLDIADHLSPEAILLSIDGDTVVSPGLRTGYETEFAHGFDLVCGNVSFPPEEAARLPPADPQSEAVLRIYREMSRHIAALVCPDPDNPWPHHGSIFGANFAMRAGAYRSGGPLPTPLFGEDRALRRRFEAAGLRVRYSDLPRAETSCRLIGRAAFGLADELARNRLEIDPIVDELLEPAETLLLRCRSRAAFCGAASVEARTAVLRTLDLTAADCERLASAGGEAAWQAAEDLSRHLHRTRLRLSDLRRLLPALQASLASILEARSDSPTSPAA